MSTVPQPADNENDVDIDHPEWCSADVCSIGLREVEHRSAGDLFEPSDDLTEHGFALELTRWRSDPFDEGGQHHGPVMVEVTQAWSGEQVTVVNADDAARLAAMLLAGTRADD